MAKDHPNGGLRAYYDANAEVYDQWMRSYDRVLLGDARAELCGDARGRTLEVAVGTGLNLPHYRHDVKLVAVDYSPEMLHRAAIRAAGLKRAIALEVADARALPFDDAQFDTVVTALFLSSATDPDRCVAEMFRVLRRGGSLRCLDHGRSHHRAIAWMEHVTRPFMASRTGVHLDRDPAEPLRAAGFVVESHHRSRLGVIHLVTAKKPA